MVKRNIARTLLAVALAGGTAAAVAQPAYPSKPISMVVPFAAGGPTDVVARTMAEAMSKAMGGNIVVENKPGAGGTIAVADVARAQPDGYRILVHHIGMSTAPALYRKLSYDPLKDFEYVGLVNEVPMTFLARNDLPVKTFKELIPYVKANASKVTLANAGVGSASHLCGLMFLSAIETDLTTVPYKGTAPAMTDLIGGQVDLLCDQTTNTTQQIKSGRVKALAVTTPKRLDTLKDLPTTAESGLAALQVSVWHGIYAPKGTPKPVLDKLTAAMQAALKDPNVAARFKELGTEPIAANRANGAALQAHLKAEIDKWSPIIKAAGVYAD